MGPHICVSNITIIGSYNGLSLPSRLVIIWANAGILLICTDLSEILIELHKASFRKMHLKMSSAKCRPFCFGVNQLRAPRKLYCDTTIASRHPQNNLLHLIIICFALWRYMTSGISFVVCPNNGQEHINPFLPIRQKQHETKRKYSNPEESCRFSKDSRWRHQMEVFSASLAICAGTSPDEKFASILPMFSQTHQRPYASPTDIDIQLPWHDF